MDMGSNTLSALAKSCPRISSRGVPKSSTPTPKKDCMTEVTSTVSKMSIAMCFYYWIFRMPIIGEFDAIVRTCFFKGYYVLQVAR